MQAESISLFLAVAAGLVSFASPCVLPLVPSYISFIGGQTVIPGKDNYTVVRRQLILRTLGFILGFTTVFVLLGIAFTTTAIAFSGINRWINLVAGAVVALFGLNMIFHFMNFLNYEKRYHFNSSPTGAAGSVLIGMAFAAGWSPCIGPILASILAIAASTGDIAGGSLLLAAYSTGLAVPFLLTSAFLGRAESVLKKMKRHMLSIQRVSGLVLVVVGLLIMTGRFQRMTAWFYQAGFRLNNWHQVNPLTSRLLFSLLLLLPAVLLGLPLLRRFKVRAGEQETIGVLRLTAALLFLALALLQISGLIEIPLLFSRWLSFQGI